VPTAAAGDFAGDVRSSPDYWREAPRAPAPPAAQAQARRRGARDRRDIKQAAREPASLPARAMPARCTTRLTNGARAVRALERLSTTPPTCVPGLVPTRGRGRGRSRGCARRQGRREIDQGILCNQFLADPECGLHLCHAMLLPREESPEALAKFRARRPARPGRRQGRAHGKAARAVLSNQRFLNSEDNSTQLATEIGADVCILDPQSRIAVLARRRRAGRQVCRPPRLQRRHQPHAPLSTARSRSCGS
jgi:thioesterase DpgC